MIRILSSALIVLGKIVWNKKIKSTTEKALNYCLWAIRSQLFWDGNKRTSNIVANAILISNGKGILNIEEKDLEEYNIKLSEYYLSGDNRKMLKFLYDNAIEGIHIDKKIEMENKKILLKLEKEK